MNKIRIPISIFDEGDISFTFPDSMVSFWIRRDKPEAFYHLRYRGHVFTLSDVRTFMTKELLSNIEEYIQRVQSLMLKLWNHEIAKKNSI